MEISVQDAAARLGVQEPRVRQLIRAGDLRAERVGGIWLVSQEDVAVLAGRRRVPGRPLGPRRAWALLGLLAGAEPARWLSPAARSQVRSSLVDLRDADADHLRARLRGRSELLYMQAHPAALPRLLALPGVLRAGASEAGRRGFDLVALDDAAVEVYMKADRWDEVAGLLSIRPAAGGQGNLVVRQPVAVWPFDDHAGVSDAVLAADLLESAEPRAVSAGASRLRELIEGVLA